MGETAFAADDIPIKTIQKLCEVGETFWIPSYQRGYRWGEPEVRDLLGDLEDYHRDMECAPEHDKGYVLQPLMVAAHGDGPWAVVDGQQRLTTLLVLLSFAQRVGVENVPSSLFKIQYSTRKGSYDFLNNWITSGKLDPQADAHAESESSIDAHYMFEAWKSIRKVFSSRNDRQTWLTGIVEEALRARFIWYVIDGDGNAETSQHDAFARANTGKIRLTGGELVKAIYLRNDRSPSTAGNDPRQSIDERIRRWNDLEARLHDDDFWGFLAPVNKPETRIDLLLWEAAPDCHGKYKEKSKSDSDVDPGRELFDCYAKDQELEKTWENVKAHARLLEDWYRETRVYHRVGFLNAIRQPVTVGTVKTPTKSRLVDELDQRIRNYIKGKVQDLPLDSLTYGEHSAILKHLLLLFNVLEEERAGRRFPFAEFNRAPMDQWSLEHITAQNQEALTPSMYNSYLKNLLDYIAVFPEQDSANCGEIVQEIRDYLDNSPNRSSSDAEKGFSDLLDRVSTSIKGLGLQLHSIDNLALLHKSHNSSLSNAFFPEKRRKTLELWSGIEIANNGNGSIIVPPATVRVFSKAYDTTGTVSGTSGNLTIGVWLPADRDAYLKRLRDILSPYLPEDNTGSST